MVMEKNKRSTRNTRNTKNYVYGSVAYDIQPEIKQERKPVKRKKAKSKVKIKLKVVGSVMVIALISLLTLTRFASMIRLTYDIREVKSDIKKVQEANENTRVQMAKMSNIKSIEKTAVNELGMVIPDTSQIVYMDVKPLTALTEESKEGIKTATNDFMQKIFGLIH